MALRIVAFSNLVTLTAWTEKVNEIDETKFSSVFIIFTDFPLFL